MDARQRADQPAPERRRKADLDAEEGREPRYHVYIRLPFNRGDFVDPGTVSSALCQPWTAHHGFWTSGLETDISVLKGELERKEIRGAMEYLV